MIEHAPAQIGSDALADPRHVVEAHVGRHRHDRDDGEQLEQRTVELGADAGGEPAVDHQLEPLPDRQRAAGGDQKRDAGVHEAAPVRCEEAAQASQRAHDRRPRRRG